MFYVIRMVIVETGAVETCAGYSWSCRVDLFFVFVLNVLNEKSEEEKFNKFLKTS